MRIIFQPSKFFSCLSLFSLAMVLLAQPLWAQQVPLNNEEILELFKNSEKVIAFDLPITPSDWTVQCSEKEDQSLLMDSQFTLGMTSMANVVARGIVNPPGAEQKHVKDLFAISNTDEKVTLELRRTNAFRDGLLGFLNRREVGKKFQVYFDPAQRPTWLMMVAQGDMKEVMVLTDSNTFKSDVAPALSTLIENNPELKRKKIKLHWEE